MAKDIKIRLVGDSKDFENALNRAGKAGHTFGQKVQKGARIAGLALAGGLAVAAKVGWDEMAEGQKVAAQTAAVLKSTGNAANTTAKQVDTLATSLMMKSGVDDEAIKSGENMLLTFTNIQNRVGKSNDIFDQATKATLDMSVAMGMDMPKAALQVGKALNDPVKGMTKLQRIGVTFTDAQKKAVEQMVKTGDVAGAQKVILKELNKEFGGSAEAAGKTLPGKLAIARESLKNVAGEMMQNLIPAITLVAENLSKLAGYLSEHPRLAKALVIGLGALAVALLAASVASTLLNLSLLANPVGLIVIGLVALGIALVVAYKKFDTFRAVVDAVFGFIKDHWLLLGTILTGGMFLIVTKIIQHWGTIKEKATTVINFIKDHWKTIFPVFALIKAVIDKVRGHFDQVRDKARSVFGAVRDAIQWAIDKVQWLIDKVKLLIGWVEKIPAIPNFGGGSGGEPQGGGRGSQAPGANPRTSNSIGSPRGPMVANVYLDGNMIAQAAFNPMRNQAAAFKRANGQAAF